MLDHLDHSEADASEDTAPAGYEFPSQPFTCNEDDDEDNQSFVRGYN